MGYSLSWAALKNGTLETICSVCNLRLTGERERFPKSKVVAAEISSGWHLVLFKRCELDDRMLAELSAENEVVSCFVEDHVMELAKALTGFRHDEDIQNARGDAYVVLEAAIGGEKSLIARIVTLFKGSSPSSVLILLVFGILLLPVLLAGAHIVVPFVWG